MTKRKAQEAAQVKADIQNQFAKLDSAAADSPGLDTVLKVYGGYEAALKRVDEYFALLRAAPHFTVSTTSGELSDRNADVV